eukprot:7595519-Pyramimonas_sp.AAC.1
MIVNGINLLSSAAAPCSSTLSARCPEGAFIKSSTLAPFPGKEHVHLRAGDDRLLVPLLQNQDRPQIRHSSDPG